MELLVSLEVWESDAVGMFIPHRFITSFVTEWGGKNVCIHSHFVSLVPPNVFLESNKHVVTFPVLK